jgi:hypothetical protein
MVALIPDDNARHIGRQRLGLRRLAIGIFFGSVAVNAALGLLALLIGDFSQTHGRILGTSLLVTAALLGALACAPAWERHVLWPVPYVGAVASVVAATFGIVLIWTGGEGQTLGKLMGTAATIAVGSVLASLLAYPRLARRFRPVLLTAIGLDALAVAMANVAFWAEVNSPAYARSFGVVAVLLAATAVSIPVLSRIDRPEEVLESAEPVSFCPYCGASATADGDGIVCGSCGRRFSIVDLSREWKSSTSAPA